MTSAISEAIIQNSIVADANNAVDKVEAEVTSDVPSGLVEMDSSKLDRASPIEESEKSRGLVDSDNSEVYLTPTGTEGQTMHVVEHDLQYETAALQQDADVDLQVMRTVDNVLKQVIFFFSLIRFSLN